jgi:hypothetical protein
MADTTIGSEIKDPNQKFIYLYDFNKNWTFLVELINVSKEESSRINYPSSVRAEGIAPSQYGTKGLLGEKFTEIEEKYDLSQASEGFAEKDENGEDFASSDDASVEEESDEV